MPWWAWLLIGLVGLLLLYALVSWWTWWRVTRASSHSRLSDLPHPSVDPSRYQGLWYEQARYDTWFERGCGGATAHYAWYPESQSLEVHNRCLRRASPGEREAVVSSEAHGWAYPTDSDGVLGVSFFPGIYGTYAIVFYNGDTSVVTNDDLSTLWVLHRRPTLTRGERSHLWTWLRTHGFDTSRLLEPDPSLYALH